MANKKLKGIIWPNLPNDTYLLDSGEVNYDPEETYREGSTGKALQNKAEVDGYYSNLTAGSAEQLLSTVTIEDEIPYLFRTAGGSVDIGDREYINGIVGGTVAWNQLVQNGNFADSSRWNANEGTISILNNVLTITSTAANNVGIYQSVSTINGHKYLLSGNIEITTDASSVNMRWVLSDGGSGTEKDTGSIPSGIKTTSSIIVSPASNWGRLYILTAYSGSGMSVGDTIKFSNFMCFDLTQMFGSTIADYIYSLETANAGAGVAFFKSLFPKPYYAYNSGELKSVSGLVSHDMVGFNAWDEEWETGSINLTTGSNENSNSTIRSKNFIRVIPNTTYRFTCTSNKGGFIFGYDANKNYVGRTSKQNSTFVTEPTWEYIRFRMFDPDYGGTYNHDICINLSWDGSRDGEYEPYQKWSYPLDSDLELRGIPKLDANNNLYYDGDVYESDGTVTRKYGVYTFTGNETIQTTTYGGHNRFEFPSALPANGTFYSGTVQKILCTNYTAIGNGPVSNNATDKCINIYQKGIYIRDDSLADTSAMRTFLTNAYNSGNPVAFVYELATPTTETADPYTNPQIVNDFGTEEYVSTNIVPVGHKTQYMPNLRAKLEMAPNSPNGNGDYIVRQTNGMNEYVPLVIEDALPTMPSAVGTYKLTVTVTDGSDPVLSWEAE